MSDTYMIYAPNGRGVEVDKKTKEIYFAQSVDPVGKYTKEYTKVFFKAWEIMENSPYKDYKPIYLDPNFYTGQASTLLEFKDWQSIYLKEPIKG
ncbi:hypothetical protein JKM37_001716, partial [Campylobacter coli]|nr:hypothetical protein [Campylobacter coli]